MKPADRQGGPRAALFRSKSLPSDYRGVKTGTYLRCKKRFLTSGTTKRYGERGEKRELLIFTLCHRAHDFPTFPEPNFPSAYFEIFDHVQKFPTKFQRNFKNIFNKIFNEIFNKFFTKFSNNISKFYHEGSACPCV